jgi:hypothetical protein
MKYDEFLAKLRQTQAEFKKARGKDPTLEELIAFTEARVIKPRTRGLKSVRGLFIGFLMLYPKHGMDYLLSHSCCFGPSLYWSNQIGDSSYGAYGKP